MPHDKGQLSPDEWDELLAPVSGLTKKQRGQLQQAWVLRWSGLQEHPEPMVGSALLREHSKELLRLLLRMHVDTDAVVALVERALEHTLRQRAFGGVSVEPLNG